VRAVVGCESRAAAISWAASPGALSYTATLENTQGGTICCTTDSTTCNVTGLPCGQMYVLLVTAEGLTCNSSQSAGILTRTGKERSTHTHTLLPFPLPNATNFASVI